MLGMSVGRVLAAAFTISLALSACSSHDAPQVSSGGSAEGSDTSSGTVYLEGSPVSFDISIGGWAYRVRIESLQGVDFEVAKDDFPVGFAGISASYGGDTSGSIESLDQGRNAPNIGLQGILYEWPWSKASKPQYIPGSEFDANGELRDTNDSDASCALGSRGMNCNMNHSEWPDYWKQPGFFSTGTGFIGLSGPPLDGPNADPQGWLTEDQAQERVAVLSQQPPSIYVRLVDPTEANLCSVHIVDGKVEQADAIDGECFLLP